MMTSYIRIGGLALEPPRGWQQVVGKFINGISRARWTSTKNLLNTNPIWKVRTQGVGFISLEDMLDLGVTGPMIRAAGMKWDVRKTEPYSSYDKFDFESPDAHRERRVRAVPRASGRNAAERADHQAGAGRDAGRRLAGRRAARSCCRSAKR